jgi:hypothetical protein
MIFLAGSSNERSWGGGAVARSPGLSPRSHPVAAKGQGDNMAFYSGGKVYIYGFYPVQYPPPWQVSGFYSVMPAERRDLHFSALFTFRNIYLLAIAECYDETSL